MLGTDYAEDAAAMRHRRSRSDFRAMAAVVMFTFGVAGVVALSAGSLASPSSAVDLAVNNRDRLRTAPVPGVAEKAAQVQNMTVFGLRWAIFGFSADTQEGIMPLMQGEP